MDVYVRNIQHNLVQCGYTGLRLRYRVNVETRELVLYSTVRVTPPFLRRALTLFRQVYLIKYLRAATSELLELFPGTKFTPDLFYREYTLLVTAGREAPGDRLSVTLSL